MQWDLSGYEYVFSNMQQLVDAYKVTTFISILGTILSLIIMSMAAYSLAMPSFRYRRQITFIIFFTMLFNGGMLAWYLICTQYLGLKDNMWAMILPYCMNVFNMYLMRNFFKGLPYELVESAKIDGAGHFRILLQVILPLSKAGVVTIALFYALQYWNDFYLPLMLINKDNLFSIQYILYKMMSNIQYLSLIHI